MKKNSFLTLAIRISLTEWTFKIFTRTLSNQTLKLHHGENAKVKDVQGEAQKKQESCVISGQRTIENTEKMCFGASCNTIDL